MDRSCPNTRLRAIFACGVLTSVLAACDAGHLGNPLTLPVRGVAAAVQNASYNADRARVKAAVTAAATDLRPALPICARQPATCPHLPALLQDVPARDHVKVATELRDIKPTADWPEHATVIIMVHRR